MELTRRTFVKGSTMVAGALATGFFPQSAPAAEKPKVYFTKEISSSALFRLYSMVNQGITGKIAVKLSFYVFSAGYVAHKETVASNSKESNMLIQNLSKMAF